MVIVVTIITDGLKNAPMEYTGKNIKGLVESLSEKEWTFIIYMVANQNVVEVAMKLAIRNLRKA